MELAFLLLCLFLLCGLACGQKKDAVSEYIDDVYGSTEKPKCECVPFYQCYNNTINKHGVNIIDIRLRDGPCLSYMDTCCPLGSVDPNLPDPNTPSPTPDPDPDPSHPPHPVDPDEPPEPVRPVNNNTVERTWGCGRRNQDGVGFRITGDTHNEAQFGEFPWMIAILKEENCNCTSGHKLNVYQCGGSLIHPEVVLTAAHCVYQKDPAELKVRAGEWDTQTKKELFPHYDRYVDAIITHEKYYAGALHNDVALLILKKPFEYKEHVDVACLPRQDEEFDETDCFATGWGKNVFGKKGTYQVILKKIQLPTVRRDVCLQALRKTRLGQRFELHESFICAGGEKGKDTCEGDGGSPLVCPITSKAGYFTQAGIVAWGIGCGDDGTPAVYVNVAKFRHWIDEKLSQLNIDTFSYDS